MIKRTIVTTDFGLNGEVIRKVMETIHREKPDEPEFDPEFLWNAYHDVCKGAEVTD